MKRIIAIALALVMVVAFSAVAFADGPKGNGPQGGPGMGGQIQRGGMNGQNGQQPPEMPNGEAPQGGFEQNGQQPPEMPNGEAPQGGMNGQNGPMGGPGMGGQDPINAMFDAVNALEDETVKANIEALMQAEFDAIVAERDAEDKDAAAEVVAAAREALGNAPGMGGMNGFDPINAIFEAVNALEDETVKANIEALLQAELDAMEAERDAEDKDAAAEAVAATREALQAALAEAGIEFTMPEMGGQQPPELPNK